MPRVTGIVKPHEALPGVARLDRAVNGWTNRRVLGPLADAAISRLSTAADHSVLWAGTALGIAATGRRGREAALRGYGSLLVASVLANVVGKTVFGGERPSLEPLPLWRRLADPPTSPSFPSGHSASAAAFVTGVAIEWPTLGLALAPVAGAVMYSRLHTGSHWFSDVAAGAALGAGVALVGRALVPDGAERGLDVPAGPPAVVPALDDGVGLFVVVNPAAGSGRLLKEDPLVALREGLPRAVVHVLGEDDDLRRLFDDAAADGARALGISGGDGTVSTAAAAARAHDLPLAVFPGGTLNHFARAADLTSMGATVAAVRTGAGVTIDVADLEVDGVDGPPRTVLNTFSAGVYPELVSEREKHEHRLGKWPAAVLAAARVLRRAHRVRMAVDGHEGEYWSLFAGVNRYYPQSLAPVERRRLDDGVLDVRTARAERRASRLRTFLEVAAGDTGTRVARRVPGVRSHLVVDATVVPTLELRFPAQGAVVGPDGPAPPDGGASPEAAGPPPVVLAHDGETLALDGSGGDDAVTVRLTMRRGAVRIYAPRDPTAG
ncbi:bifunctional phosphatase PAP2/diacylglycerol kinase family protein [Cellulosimicrobium cellulans]|uniref:bifunctional phosphatase PAP2/diacylglycerol kinase family protein n=1 Tax=Cellulosimicrobium cellulans TaxID=1710 RepID=UPI0024073286|nr:bifunctional phosphatase PAP2/diacylglycerol kinase family protein [Cellulosimicrobium cellulans]MDF9877023.1 diacylglycerol kinase family enzyme/membrane-associated phospholipid phosphatase [Cellulosimicrobium cellulans]